MWHCRPLRVVNATRVMGAVRFFCAAFEVLMKKFIILTIGICISAIVLVLALIIFGWILTRDDISYQDTEEVFPSVYVTAELRRSHPFLAEYHRVATVTIGKMVQRVDFGIEPGGHSDIHVYEHEQKLVLILPDVTWFMFDLKTGELGIESKIWGSPLPERYLGKFTHNGRIWRFHRAEEGTYEGPYILHGG